MEKLKHITGIFFDLGGTLLYPPSGSWMFSDLAYRYFPREALGSPQAAPMMEEAGRVLHSDHLLTGLDEEYQRFLQYYTTVAKGLGLSLTQEELGLVTRDKLDKRGNYRLFDDTKATLKALRGRYRLGIISDTWPSIVPQLEYMDILRYFDCATYSFALGTLKPDPRMYEDALEKMGLPAEETLFVDDLPKNLEGARAAGIHPVLIRALPGAPVAPEGVPVIETISGLLDLLD